MRASDAGGSRDAIALQKPNVPLDSFPDHPLRRGAVVYRAHGSKNEPWWFASTPDGRFNLETPHGTCYVARDIETAVEEVLAPAAGGMRIVSEAQADSFVVSRLKPSKSYTLANIASAKAKSFGATREMSGAAGGVYVITRLWAAALAAAGFNGILYASRFTTVMSENAIALFGAAGAPSPPPSIDPTPLSGREAAVAAGYTVLPPLTRSHLTLI